MSTHDASDPQVASEIAITKSQTDPVDNEDQVPQSFTDKQDPTEDRLSSGLQTALSRLIIPKEEEASDVCTLVAHVRSLDLRTVSKDEQSRFLPPLSLEPDDEDVIAPDTIQSVVAVAIV